MRIIIFITGQGESQGAVPMAMQAMELGLSVPAEALSRSRSARSHQARTNVDFESRKIGDLHVASSICDAIDYLRRLTLSRKPAERNTKYHLV